MINIMNYLQVGVNNRTRREELVSSTGSSDRENRTLIEKAILSGEPIASSPSLPGYYIAETAEDLTPGILDLDKKIKTLQKRKYALINTRAKMRSDDQGQVDIAAFMN